MYLEKLSILFKSRGAPMGGWEVGGGSPPKLSENGPELVKNYWLVGQKLLVISAILLLNFKILQKNYPICPKFDQIDKVN